MTGVPVAKHVVVEQGLEHVPRVLENVPEGLQHPATLKHAQVTSVFTILGTAGLIIYYRLSFFHYEVSP